MRSYRFLQLDVFTDRIFGGNQLAVFPEAVGISEAEMQAVAREMNYSETTFVLPASDSRALCRVRIFTPQSELPMAGHPVIGTTFALAHDSEIRPGDASPITLELGVGPLAVDILFEDNQLSFAWMHQPAPTFETWQGDRERLAAVLGLSADDLAADLPIERGSAGVPYVYIPLRSLEALGRARPGAGVAQALHDVDPHVGAYLFTLEGVPAGVTARSRMFAPEVGVSEDAATGSAAGPFGVYLVRHGRIQPDADGEARARIEQGVEMGRPSVLDVAVDVERASGSAGEVRDVRVGGEAVFVAEGTLVLPDPTSAGA
jgi:trans-2,3-dihydro-3-hydroxyanthranilate isomerase